MLFFYQPEIGDVHDAAQPDDLHHPVPVGDEVSEEGDERRPGAVSSVDEQRQDVPPLRFHQLVSFVVFYVSNN